MLDVNDENFIHFPLHLREEKLSIEWFEAGRSLIKRNTDQGTAIHLKRTLKKYLSDGQVIYQDAEKYVRIDTLPCLCMVVQAMNPVIVGDFCFDVGNRHLPVFCVRENAYAVAYDARLYEALSAKFGSHITLEQLKLLPEEALLFF